MTELTAELQTVTFFRAIHTRKQLRRLTKACDRLALSYRVVKPVMDIDCSRWRLEVDLHIIREGADLEFGKPEDYSDA